MITRPTGERGFGRRAQDSRLPEPFWLIGDCPRCGTEDLHLFGRVWREQGKRLIMRECACGGRWRERLEG